MEDLLISLAKTPQINVDKFKLSEISMIIQAQDVGWVEVICGPMFSGKTEELIRRLRRAIRELQK